MDIVSQFSASAASYDAHSDIQRRVFAHLGSLLPEHASCVVDLGSGTGAMTAQLSQRYPDAQVLGIDAAPQMVMWAQQHLGHSRLRFVCGDIETATMPDRPDLVVSNATFQWVLDPERAVVNMKRHMAAGGTLVLSSFGPETYRELGLAIRHVWGRPVIMSASRFRDGCVLDTLLSGFFQTVTVTQYRYQRYFDSLAALLRSIKYTGSRGLPEGPKYWTPGLFREVEQVYLAHYRRIVATYQVYYCKAC